ncbi:malic enzyme-like NAD(P)-binding protein [Neobacillus sp. PS3-40]|uniref:NAD(P)-dependent malic enzyme n=1 Tax=Neobacillus sp. PS3-40 TaxID=3070679 RepID=UPI0027DF546A|nr:malic enzyme-like NAD(P)-binding protein [Neobacillus sp. PS3-40]WML43996.1 malic enzyme-like NAD(P)-binding protein [Neobacillus sp. PS3-40]
MSNLRDEALKMHKDHQGKLGVYSKVQVGNAKDLSLAYSPGVAEPCMEIYKDDNKVYDYTAKGNLVAIVSDGTAVLGLGNIGPKAAMPVMEGKAVLFKTFADVDAFPICLGTTDPDKIVETVKFLEPTFGGVNLEDISAPRCFEIEDRLRKACDIPVFHDDQHGTAIVTAAGLINALKLANKDIKDIRVVANGAGSAGVAIVKLLLHMGVKDVILCDTKGIIYEGRPYGMNKFKDEMALITNKEQKQGTVEDALVFADVFVGVSAAGVVTKEMVRSMNRDPIIFAMANPEPEIMPEDAKEAGALVVGTGRSDFPNQVNNVLAFPGIFRGALDVHAKEINEEMKLAAVLAIAGLISNEELHADYVIPDPFDRRVAAHVAAAVAKAAMETGVSQKNVSVDEIKERLLTLVDEKKPALI